MLSIIALLTGAAHAADDIGSGDSHCSGGIEEPVFHCKSKAGKYIELCLHSMNPTVPATLVYRYGTPGQPELAAPPADAANLSRWTYDYQTYSPVGEGYFVSFTNGEYTYEIFSTDIPEEQTAGVRVYRSGQVLTTVNCATEFSQNLAEIGAVLKKAGITPGGQ